MEMLAALTAAFWVNRQRHDVWKLVCRLCHSAGPGPVALSDRAPAWPASCWRWCLCWLWPCCTIPAEPVAQSWYRRWPSRFCARASGRLDHAQEVTAHLQSAVHVQDASFEQRNGPWPAIACNLPRHPLTGTGWAAFETAYPEFQTLVSRPAH